jgi:hypothetical protein
MKKVARALTVLVGLVVAGFLNALPAVASGGPAYPPEAPPAPPPGPEIAVTGRDITWGIVLLVALIVLGIAALIIGRRRVRVTR